MTGFGPRIITKGDEAAARLLLRFAKVQLNILKDHLEVGNLFQGARRYYLKGAEVKVSWVGPHPRIEIYAPPGWPERVEGRDEWRAECWCTCCFTEAKVLGVLGNYGDWPEEYSFSGDDNHLANWDGDAIRYRCEVCVSKYVKAIVICPSNDFAQYYANDPVAVYRRGRWVRNGRLFEMSECFSCLDCIESCNRAYARRNKSGSGDTGPEGTHVILPVTISGVTDDFDHGIFAAL